MNIEYTEQQRFDLQFKYHCLNFSTVEDIDWYIAVQSHKQELYRYFTNLEFLKEYIEYFPIYRVLHNFTQTKKESFDFLMQEAGKRYNYEPNMMNQIAEGVFLIQNPKFISRKFLDDHYDVYAKIRPLNYALHSIGFDEDFVIKHGIEINLTEEQIYKCLNSPHHMYTASLYPELTNMAEEFMDTEKLVLIEPYTTIYYKELYCFEHIIVFFEFTGDPYKMYYAKHERDKDYYGYKIF